MKRQSTAGDGTRYQVGSTLLFGDVESISLAVVSCDADVYVSLSVESLNCGRMNELFQELFNGFAVCCWLVLGMDLPVYAECRGFALGDEYV